VPASSWLNRLISGMGAVLINVLMTKMVADWFAGREIVPAIRILVASWPLGLALGLLLFTPTSAALKSRGVDGRAFTRLQKFSVSR
jgi:hypothetical protein